MASPHRTHFADLLGPAANSAQTPSSLSLVSNSSAPDEGEPKRKKAVDIQKSSLTSAASGLNPENTSSSASQKKPASSGGSSWSSLLSYFIGSSKTSADLPPPPVVPSAPSHSALAQPAVQEKSGMKTAKPIPKETSSLFLSLLKESESTTSKPTPAKEPSELKISKQIKTETSSSSSVSVSKAPIEEVPFEFYPDDVWGRQSQYADLRGKLICTPTTANCIAALARGEKIDGSQIDGFIRNGLALYKKIAEISEENWETAGKDRKFLNANFYPVDHTDCFRSDPSLGLQEQYTYDLAAPIPVLNPDSGDMPSYLPLKRAEFSNIFGQAMDIAKKTPNRPVVGFIVIGKPAIAVAETFGLEIKYDGKKHTYKLFNPHGTDAGRNDESGIKMGPGQPGPARLNCFVRDTFLGSVEEQFSAYFSNLLANIFADAETRITVSLWEPAEKDGPV